MFGKKAQPPIKSLIAQGSRIEGDLKFNDGLRVDGEVIGNISGATEQPSILVISEEAAISKHYRTNSLKTAHNPNTFVGRCPRVAEIGFFRKINIQSFRHGH